MADRKDPTPAVVTLVVRRTFDASPERLFEAWTSSAELQRWWGPNAVTCVHAEIDLRVGGRYRIGNQFPDGKVLWIVGTYEVLDPPRKLVYTWRQESQPEEASERVTVSFEPRGASVTEVIVVHESIPDASSREMHEKGWIGCLDGLAEYLRSA